MLTALLLLAIQSLAVQKLDAQVEKFGMPGCAAAGEELAQRKGYTACYSSERKTPVWTMHEVAVAPAGQGTAVRRGLRFRRDWELVGTSASDADYRNSGYARGHMTPAGDFADGQAVAETFLLTNAAPQDQALNQGKWRALENAVRRMAREADAVVVVTGPIYCEGAAQIGASRVAVPCQFFKAVLVVRGEGMTAYGAILPNAGNPVEPLSHFAVSVREIEARTGLDLFGELPAAVQDELETPVNVMAAR